ncbi:MAG: hypothetical protein H6767_06775 [Candidatus Peribacteria bacterium]|nr:MAG: hypothetical protein H6767_06775 [Candidatus Peribacteria bacterium]
MDEVQSLLAALDQDEKQVSYDALLEIFQQYNTVGSENTQLFARKVAYRDALLLLSDTETERQSLLRNTLYDVQDVIDAKQYEQLTQLF